MAAGFSGPWFVGGDFNDVLDPSERIGNRNFNQNRDVFGNVSQNIKAAAEALDQLEGSAQSPFSNINSQEIAAARSKLARIELAREIFWKQKSRNKWLTEGDKNTKFFHLSASNRIRKSCIFQIKLDSGVTSTDQETIKREAVSFFQTLLTAPSSPIGCPPADPAEFSIPSLISEEDNAILMQIPSLEEVRCAVVAIPQDGAPGPDAFFGAFFTSCWDIVGADIHKAAVEFFQGGEIPWAFTSSLIALIPKSTGPKSFSDYCPISLCNCIYKIFTKIVVARLSFILPKLISKEQGVFVKGRLIAENIAIAHEVFREINRKVRGGNLLLKLDMEKAYDKVDWSFLKRVLLRFSFAPP
ncbi:uncharacterized protein LOC131254332 [Magnolia sinica]|uniref:uncharacterized protein LOC131254332 n=1 Tax=Magnolia sinica TaxID=86752 RepID=UPI0026598A2A|nr:uncharacterized protein LOC131254332 [Magnolia sinica]